MGSLILIVVIFSIVWKLKGLELLVLQKSIHQKSIYQKSIQQKSIQHINAKNMKYSTYWIYSKSSEKGHQNFVLSFFPASPLFCHWLNWTKKWIQNAFSSTIFSRSLLALKDISIPFSIKNLIQVKILNEYMDFWDLWFWLSI